MKSLSQFSRQPGRSGEQFPTKSRLKYPLTDYNFHAAGSEMKTGASSQKLSRPVFAPGFRDLSNKFLGAETKRSYVAEVVLFAIMVGVSTWPIVSMIRALSEIVK